MVANATLTITLDQVDGHYIRTFTSDQLLELDAHATSTNILDANQYLIVVRDATANLFVARHTNPLRLWIGDATAAIQAGATLDQYTLGAGVDTSNTMYWASKATNSFVEADFTSTDGALATSTTGVTITIPAFTANSYQAIAVPETRGQPTSIRQEGSPFDSIGAFDRVAGTTDINSQPHIVMVSDAVWYPNLASTRWSVQ